MDRAAVIEVGCFGGTGAGEDTGGWFGANEGLGQGIETNLSTSEVAIERKEVVLELAELFNEVTSQKWSTV